MKPTFCSAEAMARWRPSLRYMGQTPSVVSFSNGVKGFTYGETGGSVGKWTMIWLDDSFYDRSLKLQKLSCLFPMPVSQD